MLRERMKGINRNRVNYTTKMRGISVVLSDVDGVIGVRLESSRCREKKIRVYLCNKAMVDKYYIDCDCDLIEKKYLENPISVCISWGSANRIIKDERKMNECFDRNSNMFKLGLYNRLEFDIQQVSYMICNYDNSIVLNHLLYHKFVLYVEKKDYEGAMINLECIMENCINESGIENIRFNMAMCLIKLKCYQQSVDILTDLIDNNNGYYYKEECYFYRSLCYYYLFKDHEAYEDLRKVNGNDYNKGIIQLSFKRYEDALVHFKKSQNERRFYHMAKILAMKDKYNKDISNVIRLFTRSTVYQNERKSAFLSFFHRGLYLMRLKRFQESWNDFVKCLHLSNGEFRDVIFVYLGRINEMKHSDNNDDHINSTVRLYDASIRLNPNSYEAYLRKGLLFKSLAKENKIYMSTALYCLDIAYKINPYNIDVLYYLGESLVDLDSFDKALGIFERIRAFWKEKDLSDEYNYNMAYLMGKCYYSLKKYQMAYDAFNVVYLEKYKHLLKGDEERIYLCHYYRGLCCIRLSRFNNAIKDFSKAMKKKKHYILYLYRAIASISLDRYQDADEDLVFVINKCPQEKRNIYYEAIIYKAKYFKWKYDHANAFTFYKHCVQAKYRTIQCVDNALSDNIPTSQLKSYAAELLPLIENDKSDFEFLFRMGIWYSRGSMYKKAMEYFQKTMELDPNHYESKYQLGKCYFNEGRYEKAIYYFKFDQNRIHSPSCFYLGQCYFQKNDYSRAKEYLMRAYRLGFEHIDLLKGIGTVNFNLKNDIKNIIFWYTKQLKRYPNDIHSVFLLGMKLYDCKNYTEAIPHFRKVLKNSNTSYDYISRFRLSKCFMELKMYKLACFGFTECLKKNPKDYKCYIPRVESCQTKEEYETAEKEIEMYINRVPERGEHIEIVFYALGICRYHTDQFKRCLSILEILLDMHSKVDYMYYKGMCLFHLKRYHESLSIFNIINGIFQTREVDSKFDIFSSLCDYGCCLFFLKRFKESITCFTKIIKRKPTARAYRLRAKAYECMNDLENCIADLDKGIELNDSDDCTYYLERGIILHRIGRYDDAIKDLNKFIISVAFFNDVRYYSIISLLLPGIKFHALHSIGLLIRAKCFYELSKYVECIIDVTNVLAMDPKNDEALRLKGLCYVSQERDVEGIAILIKIKRKMPNDIEVLFNIGIAECRLGFTEKAIDNFKRIIQLKNDHVNSWFNLSGIYITLGRIDDANRALENCIKCSQQPLITLQCYMRRGTLFLRKELPLLAIKDFEKAYAIFPLPEIKAKITSIVESLVALDI